MSAQILSHPSAPTQAQPPAAALGDFSSAVRAMALDTLSFAIHHTDVTRGLAADPAFWLDDTHRRNCRARAALAMRLAQPERIAAVAELVARDLYTSHSAHVPSLNEARVVAKFVVYAMLERLCDPVTLGVRG